MGYLPRSSMQTRGPSKENGINVRAASQVGVIDGVGEFEAQLNVFGGKRSKDLFADGSSQLGERVCGTESCSLTSLRHVFGPRGNAFSLT